MNKEINNKWKKALLWLSGYLTIIAFVIVGGYFVYKTDDKELKKETKRALIVTLIFEGLLAFLALYNYFGGFVSSYYGSPAYNFYGITRNIVMIAKIVVYAVFVLISLFANNDGSANKVENKANEKTDKKADEKEVEVVVENKETEEKETKSSKKSKKE